MDKPDHRPRPLESKTSLADIAKFLRVEDIVQLCQVNLPEQMPTGAHWGAVLFVRRSSWNEGYDKGDSGYTSYHDDTKYLACTEEQLKALILAVDKEKEKTGSEIKGLRFFRVDGMGKSQTTVTVAVSKE